MHPTLVHPLANLLVLLGVVGGSLGAQSNTALVSYPNDAVSALWGNCYVVGSNAGVCDNSRSQILIPARFLPPTGGTITAIDFNTFNTSSITYQLLDVSLGNTTATVLDPTFAVNQPSRTVVLSAPNSTINWNANAWTRLRFNNPFAHQGGRGLVIDVQKIVASATGNAFHYTTLQEREDLPRSIMAPSFAATAATVSTSSWRCRLVFSDRATVTIGSDLSPGITPRHYQLGNVATLNAYGFSGQGVSILVDLGNTIQPTPFTIPGINGTAWFDFATTLVFPLINLPATGNVTLTLSIPNTPSLANTRLGIQALSLDPAIGVHFTNYTDGFITS